MDRNPVKILLIEDNPGDVRLIREMLLETGASSFDLEFVDCLAAGLVRLGQPGINVVLLDLSLSDSHGLDTLDAINEQAPDVPIIVLTGLDDEKIAVEAVQRGAQDYLVKGQVDFPLLTRTIRYAIERKRTEQELRTALLKAETERAKTEAIIAGIGDGLSIVDRDFKITYQNEKYKELVGDRVGEFCFWFCSEKGKACTYCPVTKSFEDGRVHTEQRTIDTTSGEICADIIASPLRDAAGNIVGGIKVVRDVTEQKLAEQALKASEERYRDLFENASDLIQSVNADGRFQYVNRAWRQALGYTEEEIGGLSFFDIIHPDYRSHYRNIFKRALRGEDVGNVEAAFLTGDGRKIIVEGSVSVRFVDGSAVSCRGIFRDITGRRRAEKEKELMQAQLLQAQKLEAVGTLAGGMAHDFNNILTIIQGYSELAIKETTEDEPLHKDLKAIAKACERAANIVRQLLVFSRKQPMAFMPLNVSYTVTNLLNMLSRLIGEDIVIHTDMAPGLWAVSADPGNLEQVVMNLAVNARDAMPDGGELVMQTRNVIVDEEYAKVVRNGWPGKFVCLSLSDNGSGMEPEELQHIFEPFYTTKEVGKGTGLGLAVAYGIVEQHRGWIEVQSTPGKGSEFKVFLPVITRESTQDVQEIVSFDTLQGNNERILLVEDEMNLRELTSTALEKNGYAIFAARNGEEAQAIFDREKGDFQLIFSDVVLPDINGVQLADRLRVKALELKVLLSSGYSGRKSQRDTIRKKGFHFLQKPYSLADLLSTVKNCITRQPLEKSRHIPSE